jgi:hypothetical protein
MVQPGPASPWIDKALVHPVLMTAISSIAGFMPLAACAAAQ